MSIDERDDRPDDPAEAGGTVGAPDDASRGGDALATPQGGRRGGGAAGAADDAGVGDPAEEAVRRRQAEELAGTLTVDERRVADTLGELIVELKPETAGRIRHAARLQSDVGLDSVTIIDLVIAAEDEFEIEIPDDETGDLMDASLAELARRVHQLAG